MLLVVAFHAGLPVPGGFIGVDVFFVISGYVITMLLLRNWDIDGAINFRDFYVRRFKRLTPALALTITVTLLASIFLTSPIRSQELAALTGAGAILLVANFVIALTTGGYFDTAAALNPLLNTWSLSVEEQFYLIFPGLLAFALTLAARKSNRLRRSLVPAVISVVFCLSLLVALSNGLGFFGSRLSSLLGFYSPVSRAWEFAAGALLVFAAPVITRLVRIRAIRMLLSALGLALLAVSAFVITETKLYPSAWTLLPVLATALLLSAGSGANASGNSWLKVRPLVKIGDWSYSIYLWHWPLIVFSIALWPGNHWVPILAALVSLPIAMASYALLENPVRRMPNLTDGRLARLIVLTMSPPLLVASCLWVISAGPLKSASTVNFEAGLGPPHEISTRGCDSAAPLSADSWKLCRWGSQVHVTDPVYLVGDSNAGHFIEGLAGAASAAGRPLIAATSNACPMVGVGLRDSLSSRSWNSTCDTYVTQSLDYLRQAPPGTVVIANSDYYWSDSRFSISATEQGGSSAEPTIQAVVAPFQAMISSLQESGHKVLLVDTVPQWVGNHPWSPDSCTALKVWNASCQTSAAEQELETRQAPGRQLLQEVSSPSGAEVEDPWSQICRNARCSTSDSSLQIYRDAGHITVAKSRSLAPWFGNRLSGLTDSATLTQEAQ